MNASAAPAVSSTSAGPRPCRAATAASPRRGRVGGQSRPARRQLAGSHVGGVRRRTFTARSSRPGRDLAVAVVAEQVVVIHGVARGRSHRRTAAPVAGNRPSAGAGRTRAASADAKPSTLAASQPPGRRAPATGVTWVRWNSCPVHARARPGPGPSRRRRPRVPVAERAAAASSRRRRRAPRTSARRPATGTGRAGQRIPRRPAARGDRRGDLGAQRACSPTARRRAPRGSRRR